MIVTLIFLGLMAAAGFGYLYAAAHLRWNQLPVNDNAWDGVERRTVRGRPHIAGVAVTDAQLREFQQSLAAEYAAVLR